jgi:hypothetical protein
VTDIQTGQPTLNTLVGLYIPNDTLTPTKTKPYYFTRTDTSGIFLLENVKDGRYKLFAFDDKNLNFILNPNTEKVAILKGDLNLTANNDTLKLQLFYVLQHASTLRQDAAARQHVYVCVRSGV